MAEKKVTLKKARVLLDCLIDGIAYRCNQLIEAEAAIIDKAEKDGVADSHPSAVAAAEK